MKEKFCKWAMAPWYTKGQARALLLPLALMFKWLVTLRLKYYRKRQHKAQRLPVPVIVVGNIMVGGTGKSPLTIYLVELCKQRGLKPGVISRGYSGHAERYPQCVNANSDPAVVGDEPLMIARRTGVPVWVDPDRLKAGQALLAATPVDIIICDDGLQHLKLSRDIEIAVVDSQRGHGNGYCLPAGPLREPVSRLQTVDYVVVNGFLNVPLGAVKFNKMILAPTGLVSLKSPAHTVSLDSFSLAHPKVNGVAGIGHPERFFNTLSSASIKVVGHPFDDHHSFTRADVTFDDNLPVVMTEKDAVKCRHFATDNMWALRVDAKIDSAFTTGIIRKIDQLCGKKLGQKETA